jgi:hypothetical protein
LQKTRHAVDAVLPVHSNAAYVIASAGRSAPAAAQLSPTNNASHDQARISGEQLSGLERHLSRHAMVVGADHKAIRHIDKKTQSHLKSWIGNTSPRQRLTC